MSRLQQLLLVLAGLSSAAVFILPFSVLQDGAAVSAPFSVWLLSLVSLVLCFSWRRWQAQLPVGSALCVAASLLGALVLLAQLETLPDEARFAGGYGAAVVAAWLLAWLAVELLTACPPQPGVLHRLWSLSIPFLFGLWLLLLWEFAVRALQVPAVLLPAPSAVGVRFVASLDILWVDFMQTFVKSVLSGYVMGCAAGFGVAVLIDRSPFLQRGLLPLGNLASALPIVGVAPIMVMWFGFDWQSKAAVVVVMTFFPMLVNTVEGLAASSAMQRDLMRSYGASYWQSLFKLRLPAAMPMVFNALKINSTLALIGAIVAEFFGTPIVGMGFRISTEVGRMNLDMVWAEITVAAIAGSLFYWAVSQVERWVAHWHPSIRRP